MKNMKNTAAEHRAANCFHRCSASFSHLLLPSLVVVVTQFLDFLFILACIGLLTVAIGRRGMRFSLHRAALLGAVGSDFSRLFGLGDIAVLFVEVRSVGHRETESIEAAVKGGSME